MEKLFYRKSGVKGRVLARFLQRQVACQGSGTYLAGMRKLLRWLFGPPLDNHAGTAADLAALRQRLELVEQEQQASRRAFAALDVDMTGLADKLSRQLKRIRQRAVGAQNGADDDDEQQEFTLADFHRMRG